MRKPSFMYVVYTGNGYTSKHEFTNWNETQQFIKYLLDNDQLVKSVTKEEIK